MFEISRAVRCAHEISEPLQNPILHARKDDILQNPILHARNDDILGERSNVGTPKAHSSDPQSESNNAAQGRMPLQFCAQARATQHAMTSRLSQALPALRALSQRALSSAAAPSSIPPAAEQAAVHRALAAAAAIARRSQPAPAPAAASQRAPSAAQFAAVAQQELTQVVEVQLAAQMESLQRAKAAAQADTAMQAAADHLRGIPLRSKGEYKSMIAAYNAARR
jgi:hypothetical protein